jgi:hypothetical protein
MVSAFGPKAAAFGLALAGIALSPVGVRPIVAADLEIGDPARLPRPGAAELPPQYPLEGRLLQFAPGPDASRAFRDKIARHAERPLLVLVVPDATAGQANNPRLVWLGNLLRSADRDIQRALGLMDVEPALLRDIQTVIPDARPEALCYLVGLRDGRSFAWPMSVTDPSEAAFQRIVAANVLSGSHPAARSRAYLEGLTADERTRLNAAVRDLGADDFLKREAAGAALTRRMPAVGPYLLTVLESAKDPEVRSRCSGVLVDAGRDWLTRPPTGCTWIPWHGGRIGVAPAVQLQLEVRAVPAN